MATIASQVVLHPTVSQGLKFGGTTLGRDKAYRAIQYFSRFYAWFLLSRSEKEAAARWNALKTHLATARKLLRLGKPLEHLQAALKAALVSGPAGEQITTIGRQIGYFGYLSFDALVWVNAVKFYSFSSETGVKISKLANRFWLAGIVLSIMNGALKSVRLAKEERRLKRSMAMPEKEIGQEAEEEMKLSTILASRDATRHQLVIDLLDLWIPATALGLSNMNDGVLGIFGLITSLMAGQKQWQSVNGKK
ncbi:peroxisomal biogenesis factor 11 [Lentinula raphanica]|uniref:Peroxisomal biogenesis factor 11 n=1 Tax=Lentinula raphanica TaxID=153919 RepID=A0AA38UFN6_9AGAR|nr:peroxisomal biogenesis factor 11 [Lentinula raphanica]KAJ3839804.1 peroxisomal biogenesis factor 11 [Lentinula raphanica]